MRLEHLFDGEYRYDAPPTIVRSPNGHEARAFGGGSGRLSGDRLSGEIAWSNFPRSRDDGAFLPNLTGKITSDDGAVVPFETHGISIVGADGSQRRICSSLRFHTDGEGLRWLNDVVAVEEGVIDMTTGVVRTRGWLCVPDDQR